MDLNLDELEYANVKLKGKVHKLRLPSVLEVHKFEQAVQDKQKDVDAIVECYSEYFTGLGLDAEVAAGLNMFQFRKLHNSLAGLEQKK